MNAEREENIVYFIGAGAGDPELITVKGKRLLESADTVIYTGSLIPRALVADLVGEVINSASLNLDEVIALIKENWRNGKRVVRLHTGDPAIYGAINEQMAFLRKENIPFAVVPGVSSALAAAASLQTQLTLPEVSQTVIFTRAEGRTPMPKGQDIRSLAGHNATIMIFLSINMIEEIVRELREGGYSENTPVAVVEKASWPEERQIRGTLATIASLVKEAGITKTAIIAVGDVLTMGDPPALSKLYDKEFTHGFRRGI